MEYVDKLLQETDFLEQLKKLEQLEQNREFCKHGLNHLLDTARIAWISYLEFLQGLDKDCGIAQLKSIELKKETIYLAALLHDLGRIREYEEGISHHLASADFAENYLTKIGYPKEQSNMIVAAVYGHREGLRKQGSFLFSEDETRCKDIQVVGEILEKLLYFADKKSRNCFFCLANKNCNWMQERRNMGIVV